MVDTVIINKSTETPNPTLEDSAKALGLDEQGNPVAEPNAKILGKFTSQEELEKAYQELEKKLGSKAKDPIEGSPDDNKSNTEPNPFTPDETKTDQENAKAAVENAGLNFDDLSNRYYAEGKLGDDDYAALEKAGIPKAMVDQFIEGQEAIAAVQRGKVVSAVGGEEEYQATLEWAAKNLTPKEIEAYNEAVENDDIDKVIYAAKSLRARFENSAGKEPSLTLAGDTSSSKLDTYESVAQLQKDMNTKEYWNDPAYRKKVEDKLARSNIL